MTADLKLQLLTFLRAHQVLTLAVAGPYAAALFYAVDDELNLYVLTDPATRHGLALSRSDRVAGTIQRDRQRWQEIRGVQLTGRCERLTGAERAAGWALFLQRFALAGAAELAPALAKVELWKITPDWLRLIDNQQGFGHKAEWTRPQHPLSGLAGAGQ